MCTIQTTQYSGKSYDRGEFYNLYFSEPFFAHVLCLVEEAFIKVVKPSVSIQEADSAHLCHFQLCFYIDRIRSIHGRKQILMTSYFTEIASIYILYE